MFWVGHMLIKHRKWLSYSIRNSAGCTISSNLSLESNNFCSPMMKEFVNVNWHSHLLWNPNLLFTQPKLYSLSGVNMDYFMKPIWTTLWSQYGLLYEVLVYMIVGTVQKNIEIEIKWILNPRTNRNCTKQGGSGTNDDIGESAGDMLSPILPA